MELASDALLRAAVAELGDGIFESGDRPHHGDASRLQARVAVSHDTWVIGWIRATGHATGSPEGEFLYRPDHAFPLLQYQGGSTGVARLWRRPINSLSSRRSVSVSTGGARLLDEDSTAGPPAGRRQPQPYLFDPRDGAVPAITVSGFFEPPEDEPPSVGLDALRRDDGTRDPPVLVAEAPHDRWLRVRGGGCHVESRCPESKTYSTKRLDGLKEVTG